MNQIHEYKGEQALFIESKADTLTRLLKIARIQSTEASNKIEGIYTSDERLKKLVLDKTMPRTRNEQDIAGYRDVLATIQESYDYITLPTRLSIILIEKLIEQSTETYYETLKQSSAGMA